MDGWIETRHISPVNFVDLFRGFKLRLNFDRESFNLTILRRFGRNPTSKFDWVLIVDKLNIFISLEP